MNKHLRCIYLLLITFALSTRIASAQTTFGSEEELKTQAAKLFDDDEFEEAYPLYSQLASIYPKDPNYNYRLGVCMLYASDDKEKPIPFLEFAASKPDVEKEVFFYLARAYHLNYRFDDAIKEYQLYKGVATSAKAEKLMVDRQIEMCKNGKKLLHDLTDLVVIDKKEMSRTDFFRSYDISDIGGKLLVKPDEEVFKTALDKKKKEKSIIYLSTNNNQVFFSSYGDDPERGKDIYIIRKLPTGEWSKPQTLGYPVNTEYDEDFPFLHPNGKVLYFCSKGHNSMGGYDIFKTTLNEETNTWNKPVNLDFPINTPDDDILYVTNEDEKEAYFSSARASKTGKTAVYHINVERKPIDITIIKGAVVKNREGQALDVKITVKDLNDNDILGIFNSKAANGVYLINIPNGGKFLFTVEATGFSTQSDVVDVPVQYVFKPMKQEISYEPGTDKLIIKNMFDEEMDESSYLLALNFIKEKSKMEVNANDATASSIPKDTVENKVQNTAVADKTNVATGTKLTNDDIVKMAYNDAKDVEKEAADLKEQADVALVLANEKNELAQNKAKEATQLMADAAKMEDNVKKQTTVDEANQVNADAEELNLETVAAFNLAKKLDFRAESKQEEADLSKQYAKDLEAAVKSKNPGEALTKLDEQQKKLDALSEQNNNPTFVNSLKIDADNKKRSLDKAIQASDDIKQGIADNETLISNTQAEADKEKNSKVKQGLIDQITGLKQDTEDNKNELAENELKVNKLEKEYNGIINETQLVSNVLDKAKSGTSENAAANVAVIDKTKLEQSVNSIKNANEKDNVIASSTKISDNTVKDNTSKTNDVVDNTTKDNTAKTNNVVDNTTKDNTSKTNDVVVDNTIKDNTAKTNDVVDNTFKDNATKTNDVVIDNTIKDNNVKTSDNTVKDNAITDNTIKDNTNADNIVPAVEDYNKKYTDEIAALDNIGNASDRENKKAELYKNWTNSISDELTAKKLELKSEKDKNKKKELNKVIADLDKDLKEKQQTTKTTLASAEKLKEQDSVSSDATTPDNTTIASTSETPAEVNKKYTQELADVEKITNEADRETAKADALKKWSAAIDADVANKKKDMAASDDPEMKALLALKIKDAEKLSKEKQMQADQSLAKAESLKNPGVVATITTPDNTSKTNDVAVESSTKTPDNTATKTPDNTTKTNDVAVETSTKTPDNTTTKNPDNTTKTNDVAVETSTKIPDNTTKQPDTNTTDNTVAEVSSDQKLTNELSDADKASTPLEKENKKSEAYVKYIATENELLEKAKTDLKSEKDKNKKKELTNTIASIQSAIKEKQTALDDSNAQIKTIQQSATIADNTTTNNVTSDTSDENPSDNNVTATAVKPFVYSSATTSEQSLKADDLNKQADELIGQSNELKTKAANTSVASEKNAAFAEAEKLDKQAENKKLESAEIIAVANKTEYTNNQDQLDQLAALSANNKADDISMAEMMKDEAKIYFDKAQKSRDLANSTTVFEEKQAALNDGYKNEMVALEKQKKATEIYKKYNPNFVASNVKTTPANTTPDNTTKTNDVAVNNSTKTPDNTAITTPDNTTKTNDVAVSNSTKTPDNTTITTPDNTTKTNDVAVSNSTKTVPDTTAKTSDVVVNNSTKTPDNTTTTVPDTTTKTNDVVVNNSTKTSDNTTTTTPDNSTKTNDAATSATNVVKTPDNATPDNTSANTNNKLPVTDVFVKKNAPVYSANKPIPVNEKLPEGLVYKVQIGAFRNPIPQDLFKGISPITGETTPQGFTRYTAGLFTTFTTADKVKEEIRGLGYKDAFVVAFLNGKRISITEAMTGGAIPANNQATTTPVDNTATNPVVNTNANVNTNVTPANNTQVSAANTNTSSTDVALTQNISVVSGLFYTVQVGVYSQAVSAAKLFNIQPLYSETTPNGNLRYNSGIYNNTSRASEAKNMIIGAGVKDAFVTAYYSGKRISLTEAEELAKQGPAVFSTAPDMNALPTFKRMTSAQPVNTPVATTPKTVVNTSVTPKGDNNPVVPVISTEPKPTTEPVVNEIKPTATQPIMSEEIKAQAAASNKMQIDSGVVFKVQIGAFADKVPLDMANKFLKISNKGIKNYKDEKGLTIYTVGTYRAYEEAIKVKGEVAAEAEINDAFIIAYKDGSKISVDEAKSLINK